MTIENDSYEQDLNQLRERQQAVVEEIEQLRRRNGGIVPAEIDQIQSEAVKIVEEIDDIRRQHQGDVQTRAVRRSAVALPYTGSTRPQSVRPQF